MIEPLKPDAKVEIYREDGNILAEKINSDVVYIDPPFAEDLYEECLITISKSKLLKVSSLVVVEHHHKNVIQKFYDKLQLMDQRRVGDTYLSLYSLKNS